MKKLIALLMMLVLVTGAALAEQTPFTFDDQNPGYEGEWVELKDGNLKIYLPTGFSLPMGIAPNLAESGVFTAIYSSPDSNSTYSLTKTPLSTMPSAAPLTIESIMETYKTMGDENVALENINSTDWVTTFDKNMGSITFTSVDKDAYYTVVFVTTNSDNMDETLTAARKVLMSLTLLEK